MNEKYNRIKQRVNIEEIWQGIKNESPEEVIAKKIERIKSTKLKLQASPMDPTVKAKYIASLDDSLSNLEEQSSSEKTIHHR